MTLLLYSLPPTFYFESFNWRVRGDYVTYCAIVYIFQGHSRSESEFSAHLIHLFVVSTKFHFGETIILAVLVSFVVVVRRSSHIYGNFATL